MSFRARACPAQAIPTAGGADADALAVRHADLGEGLLLLALACHATAGPAGAVRVLRFAPGATNPLLGGPTGRFVPMQVRARARGRARPPYSTVRYYYDYT